MKYINQFYFIFYIALSFMILSSCQDAIKVYESETRVFPLSLDINTYNKKTWESYVDRADVQKALNIRQDAKNIKVTLKSIKIKIEPDPDPKNAPYIEYSMNVIAPQGQGYYNFLGLTSLEVTKFLDSPSPITINLKANEIANLNGLLTQLFDPKSALPSVKFSGAIQGKLTPDSPPIAVFIGKLTVNLSLDISYWFCNYTDAAPLIDEKCYE